MKYLILLFFVVITQLALSQEKRALEKMLGEQVNEEMIDYAKRVIKNKRLTQTKALQEFGFSDFQKLETDFAFRYCSDDSVIEVVENEGVLKGSVSILIKGVNANEEKENYILSELLSIQTCEEIRNAFLTDNVITELNDTRYGTAFSNFYASYSVELVQGKKYFFSLDRFPFHIEGIDSDSAISKSIERIMTLSNYDEVKKRFYQENPYAYYFFWNSKGVYIAH